MNHTFTRFGAIASLALAALAVAPSTQAQSALWHRSSGTEWTGNLVGKNNVPGGYYFFNHDYADTTSPTTFNHFTTWNVNDFTSAGIPFAAGNQVTVDTSAAGYGSTSFQMGSGKAAYFINSYSSAYNDGTPAKPGYHSAQAPVQMFPSDTKVDAAIGGTITQNAGLRNWSLSSTAQVCLSSKYRMTYFGGESDKAIQSYFSVFIHDYHTGKDINVTVNLWDNRPDMPTEGVGWSEIGAYAHTFLGSGTQLFTAQSGTYYTLRGNPSDTDYWFHGCITRQNLSNIISRYNTYVADRSAYLLAEYQAGRITAAQYAELTNGLTAISSNLNDYGLTGNFLQTEMMKLRWNNSLGYGRYSNSYRDLAPYNLNARSHIGVTWSYHDIVTLY